VQHHGGDDVTAAIKYLQQVGEYCMTS